jgi:hypothetical protein
MALKENVAMTKIVDDILRTDLHIKGVINKQETQGNTGRYVKRAKEEATHVE